MIEILLANGCRLRDCEAVRLELLGEMARSKLKMAPTRKKA